MARDLELGIGGKSADAVRALEATAAGVDKLKRKADDLGDEFRQASRDASQLERELAKLAVESRLLAKEFSNSDVAGRASIKEKIDLNRQAATELKKIRADIIGDTEKDAKHATVLWGKAAGDLKKLVSKSSADLSGLAELFPGLAATVGKNPYALLGGVAAATVVGPPVASFAGAAVGGATIAGAGLGAVGLGVAGAAAGAPEVGKAWSAEIAKIKAEWIDASTPFIGPTIDAAHTFGDVVGGIHLDEVLEKASGYLTPLVKGAAGFAEHLAAGVGALVDSAGPEIEALRDGLPDLGADLEKSFKIIAGGAEGGADALRDMIRLIGVLSVAIAIPIRATEDIWHGLSTARDKTGEWVHAVREGIPVLGESLFLADKIANAFSSSNEGAEMHGGVLKKITPQEDDLAESTRAAGDAAEDASKKYHEYSDTLSGLFNSTNDAVSANVAYEQSVDDLAASLKEHKGAWDIDTQAGRDHISATNDAIAAAWRKHEADIAAGKSQAEADAEFRAATSSIIAQAKAAGATATVVGQLTSAWKNYLTLPSTKTFTTVFRTVGKVSKEGVIEGGVPNVRGAAYASGTAYHPGGLALVGEKGPELVSMPRGTSVYTAGETRSMMTAAGIPDMSSAGATSAWGRQASAAATAGPLNLVYNGAAEGLDGLFLSWLASQVRGGRLQLVAGDTPVKVA